MSHKLPEEYGAHAVLTATTPALQLYRVQLSVGILGVTSDEGTRVGACAKYTSHATFSLNKDNVGHVEHTSHLSLKSPQQVSIRCNFSFTPRSAWLICEDETLLIHGSNECFTPTKNLSIPAGRRNSGISAPPGCSRLMSISKFFTRIARRGPRHNDGPAIPWNSRREATAESILAHPSLQALHTTEGDLRQIANDLDPNE